MTSKELLISIKPEHLVNILNGKKTLELRKTVPKDYKGWVNIYCTKGKPYLGKNHDGNIGLYNIPAFGHFNKSGDLNGKVVARFWFDEYIELEHYDFWDESYYWKNTVISAFALEKATCMSSLEMEEYAKGKTLYAWHIKKLEIFDKPKDLSEFYKANLYTTYEVIRAYEETTHDLITYRLQRPPQSYQFVYAKEE